MPATLTRAYSILTIKSVDEAQRVLTGIATTPSTDRMGDVMESDGAQFTLPIPLLWQHDSKQPIGEVVAARVTKAGIEITARIASIAEPGKLKDRLDEAWQSIKSKLVRGLSIGFSPIEYSEIKGTYGLHFLKWLWLELSAVTIPANQDATITAVKAYDVGRPAAPGTAAPVTSTRSGAPDARRNTSMTISERIAAKKAELRTKSERLDALMTKGDAEVLSDADRQEQTTLNGEISALTADVDSLGNLEKAQALNAKAIVVTDTASGAAARAPQTIVEVKSTLPPGIEFARYLICKMAQLVSQGSVTALEVAKARYPDQPRIQHLLKAAVTAHTTGDGSNTGGTELVYAQNLVSEFIEFLRPMTIIGKFGTGNIPSLRRVPFNVRITGQTSGGAGYWVGQGKQKPLKKYDFDAVTLGFSKVAAISVLSDELARFSSPSAEALVRDALVGSLVERLDTDFIDPMKPISANVSPASITNGLVALTPSGTDADAVRADIAQLLATFIAAGIDPTNGVFIMTNTTALALSLMRNALGQREFPEITMRGGMLEGFPVIASQYAASGSPVTNLVIFVNASDIFLSDDGQATVDVSREASLEMESDPENQSGAVVSMFQANLIALRAERYINWAKRRAAAVAYLDGVAYASGSPTP